MKSLEQRMWERIEKRGPDECWIWTGACGGKGGPVITLRKKQMSTRRVMWERTHGGELPKNRNVATTCAEPRCLNPAHLYLRPWMDDAARFWSHVQKADGDACWEWQSTFFARGYGAFKMQGKERQAHRVAWEFTYGPIVGHVTHGPDTKVVMHKCDNPKCVRPDHLEIGTHMANHKDMLAKGRAAWQKDPAAFREKVRQAQLAYRSTLFTSVEKKGDE